MHRPTWAFWLLIGSRDDLCAEPLPKGQVGTYIAFSLSFLLFVSLAVVLSESITVAGAVGRAAGHSAAPTPCWMSRRVPHGLYPALVAMGLVLVPASGSDQFGCGAAPVCLYVDGCVLVHCSGEPASVRPHGTWWLECWHCRADPILAHPISPWSSFCSPSALGNHFGFSPLQWGSV